MNSEHFLTGVLIDENTTLTFIEVCHRYNIPEELLIEMAEHGLFNAPLANKDEMSLSQRDLRRIESAFRLHQDLGVNLPGIALAFDLLEELREAQQELEILRRHF
jgi:chaperone modulatory protein CbpM